MEINVKVLNEKARIPVYSSDGAACFDFFAPNGGMVSSYHPAVVETGLAFDIPAGYCMLVFSRSGDGFKQDVRLSNCVGVIDSDYTGEVKIKLTKDSYGAKLFNAGDRVAQGLIIPVNQVTFNVVEQLKETERGDGGFGSTGS